MDELLEKILGYFREHPGKAFGTLAGFLTGICLIWLGLWKTLVLWLATLAGYAIGKWVDEEGKGLKEFLEERLPGRPFLH